MAFVAWYDPSDATVPNRVTDYRGSIDVNKIAAGNWLENPSVPGVEQKYWKRSGSNVVEMTSGEKSAWDAKLAADAVQAAEDAKDFEVVFTQVEKAQTLVIMDELNQLRSWIAAFKVEVSNATSLANLKTRVASLPDTPDRDKSQIKQAIKDKHDTL
jgi:hypothetical protein